VYISHLFKCTVGIVLSKVQVDGRKHTAALQLGGCINKEQAL